MSFSVLASASAYEVENEVNYSNSNGQQYDLPLYHKLFDATEPLLQESFAGSIFGKLSSVTFEWKNGSDSEYTFLIRDMVQGTLQAHGFVTDLNIIVKDMDGNEMLHIRNANGSLMHTFEVLHNDGNIGSVEYYPNDSVNTCLKINSMNANFIVKSLHFGDFEIFRDQSSPNPLCNIKIPYGKIFIENEFSGTIIFHPDTGITNIEQLLCTAAAIAFKVTRKRCLANKDKNTTFWAYFWGIAIFSLLIGLAVFIFH
ncbi:uncharacterized protein LOC119079823 [Bradysia coprophila]|uniref:uncharacterized protein LOC119079823 n=1 Tax=Bradysia coprophila TaxID=38358 RepID=UPI00187D9E77|nr:uncharacterized protein LOC119079823 [Bradysia coprophila]